MKMKMKMKGQTTTQYYQKKEKAKQLWNNALAGTLEKPKQESYTKRGKTNRRGFWQQRPCCICGTLFDLKIHPVRKTNMGKHQLRTCSASCLLYTSPSPRDS